MAVKRSAVRPAAAGTPALVRGGTRAPHRSGGMTPATRPAREVAADVTSLLATLEQRGSAANRDGMARYAIASPRMFGVSVSVLHGLARAHRRDHALALALWRTGWLEARMLAALVDDPAQVTVAQMDAWCADFDNWAVCDHACMHLFDRTPYAFGRIRAWSTRRAEFEKRAAFALLAAVAQHDKAAPDAPFVKLLPRIERAATDERNFVKKGVSWALRGVGERSAVLHREAVALATRLAASDGTAARWVGRDALKELTSAKVVAKVAAAGRPKSR